jgi:hypothetical protein
MKIALVSLPLTWNYGGILQYYALQKVLESSGHEVHILTIRKQRKLFLLNSLVSLKWKVIKILGKMSIFGYNKLIDVEKFKQKNMTNLTDSFFSLDDVCAYLHTNSIDTLVVGSDQIWNRSATHSLDVSFLNFGYAARKFAYAASFAKDTINYSPQEIQFCIKQLETFESVSVREKSGVDILKEKLSCNGLHVLDPTLLLEPEAYPIDLDSKELDSFSEEYLFSYILDSSEVKDEFKDDFCKKLGLSNLDFVGYKGYRGVEAWLKGLSGSKFVVTDSFHGMCFAIIFKKDFIVVANKERGLDRFYSLLKLLNLESRLVYPEDLARYIFDGIKLKINWLEVTTLLNQQKNISRKFLEDI